MRAMLAEERICRINIEKEVRIHTAWDLGVSDATAIWFIQCVGRERRLVDYYESSGVGLDHYAQVLHDKRREHGWQYGEHLFPHDIAHRELSSGHSRVVTLQSLGIEPQVVRQSNVLDGINVVRRMLGRTWIDGERCDRGIEALRQYRREYDERLKDFKGNPLHDWTSHGADALRTFAAGYDDPGAFSQTSDERRRPTSSGGSGWAA
jgi:phage terminase large subunit